MNRYVLSLLFLFITSLVFSVDHTSVPLTHPVYNLLEHGELKGLLADLSDVKPYTEKLVRESLLIMDSQSSLLSHSELIVLRRYINEFNRDNILSHGLYIASETENKADLSSFKIHSYNVGYIGFKESFMDILSYNINIGFTLDKINAGAFEPYIFTKRYDGFHILSAKDGTTYGDTPYGFAFLSLPELGISLFDDSLYLGLNRVRRNWGEGISSLLIAASGRPIMGLDYSWKFNNYVKLSGILGSLSNTLGTGDNSAQFKNITAHYLEVKPNKYLDLVLFDSSIWGKRDEIGYFFLMPTFITQQIVGDFDNVAIGGSITGKLPGVGKIYFSLFIDEMINDSFSNFFSLNNNQYAWNTGVKTVIPKIPFGMFSFQYTKIEPFCYTHYMQEYPNFKNKIDTSFTNDKENIAYNLPPNSDQFLVNISTKPVSGLTTSLNYSFIRHGDNPGVELDKDGKIPISGDINVPLDYGKQGNGEYQDKNFLHDGIYEYIHTISLEAIYNFSHLVIPMELRFGYSFVTAENYENIKGNDIFMNIFTFNIKTSL